MSGFCRAFRTRTAWPSPICKRIVRSSSAGCAGLLLALAATLGCGTMKTQQATDQLLMSRAVDDSIARIDFRLFAGKKVYLDTQYLKAIKGVGFVNADYIVSSLRQQMFAARCLVQEKQEEADYVVEARVGALGADGHEVIYGVPASSTVSSAATLLPNTPVIPPIPEIALAKRNENLAAAKVAAFAYHRETKTPVWQSGMEISRSRAKDVWVLGAGPFQRGSIYDKTRFAGEELKIPTIIGGRSEEQEGNELVDYFASDVFVDSLNKDGPKSNVLQAGFADQGEDASPKNLITDDPAAAPEAKAEPPAPAAPPANTTPGKNDK